MVAVRRPRIFVLVPMLAALVVAAVAAPASAASFSTAPRVKERAVSVSRLVAVRTGRHAGFDRVVFELSGTLPGYRIQYVPKVVQDGSGFPVALAGKAFIQVVLTPTNAHLDSGAPSWPGPKRFNTGFSAVRQVASAGDFEGYVTFALGIAQRSGFRVTELRNPSRIVVDVAHPAQAGGTAAAAGGTAAAGGSQDTTGGPAVTTVPAGTGTPTGELPFTGLPLLAVLAGGVSVIGVGLALTAANRRRRALSTAR
jgi:hypothetical protein